MEILKCDSKGRLYLTSSIRSHLGERFVAVQGDGEVRLIPLPPDAVEDLALMGKKLKGPSIASLKKSIREQATREAGA